MFRKSKDQPEPSMFSWAPASLTVVNSNTSLVLDKDGTIRQVWFSPLLVFRT